jgi:hypothetical protein
VFVALAVGTLILLLRMSWAERVKHVLLYAATVVLLLAPYLAFIQLNGGVGFYFQQASAWAQRDRDRAPVVWPGLFDNPDGVSDSAKEGSGLERAVATLHDNSVAWLYYLEILLPLLAILLLASSRDGFRQGWTHARAKLGMVAVLALVLDAGFLRSPLEARLADPSVPMAVLVAWLVVAVPKGLVSASEWGPAAARRVWVARGAVLVIAGAVVFVLWAAFLPDLYRRLDKAALTERFGRPFERAGLVAAQVRRDWQFESWNEVPDHSQLLDLATYLNACTNPGDRILVQGYIPQVLALARRGFAGGHADLRPSFFGSDDMQRLTVKRLEAQSVPLILLDAGDSYGAFREWFTIVTAYIDQHYDLVGTRTFDERFGISLLARRDRKPEGTYDGFGWPCFGPGTVRS